MDEEKIKQEGEQQKNRLLFFFCFIIPLTLPLVLCIINHSLTALEKAGRAYYQESGVPPGTLAIVESMDAATGKIYFSGQREQA